MASTLRCRDCKRDFATPRGYHKHRCTAHADCAEPRADRHSYAVVTVRFDHELRRKLDTAAKRNQQSLSDFIRDAVQAAIGL